MKNNFVILSALMFLFSSSTGFAQAFNPALLDDFVAAAAASTDPESTAKVRQDCEAFCDREAANALSPICRIYEGFEEWEVCSRALFEALSDDLVEELLGRHLQCVERCRGL